MDDIVEAAKSRILVVEDEALVARELKGRLTQMGWDVVGIAYADEAIELARETQPDLLLTDIHLKGGVDGIDVANRICAEMDIPVVFLTAYSDDETVTRAKSVTPFGYIIKPVENRELQITIEMALYKFRIDKELKETQQLLATALTCLGSALVFVDDRGVIINVNQDALELFGDTAVVGRNWKVVLGQMEETSIFKTVSSALMEKAITRLSPFVVQVADQEMKLIDGIVGPMDSGGVLILRELAKINESVEMLGEPNVMFANLGPEVLSPTESSLCQILMSPDSLDVDQAHKIVERLSRQLSRYVRGTDLVSVFGGSLLSVSLPYTSITEGEQIAKTLLEQINNDLRIGEKFSFSIGLAHSTAGDKQPIELFRRAKLALNRAQSSGGGRVEIWNQGAEETHANRANEIQIEREYNNVVLLWNVMNVLSQAEDLADLSVSFCEHLFQFFKLERIGLMVRTLGSVEMVAGFSRTANALGSISDLELSAEEFRLIESLLGKSGGEGTHEAVTIYHVGGDRVLLLEHDTAPASSQTEFVRTLVTYFGTGLGRFDLSVVVEESEPSTSGNQLIYQSPQIESIIESVNLVAPTDATVLIVGDSGTGKEMLARHVHEASGRAGKPFVIVDCGAVVGSLIESELFGHVRGAFTGADKNFTGRLREANGGTVLLDEIGELPLDVQVKLLRFVQSHEVAPVGSSDYQSVDTRVIAATHRDLKAMVVEGSFREDLFYRLNVFSVRTPRLNERIEDILPLANHYLDVYSQRYKKGGLTFSREAESALLQHDWPGNIRELVNVVNRAVILCKDLTVNPIHLGLFSNADMEMVVKPPGQVSLRTRLGDLVDLALVSAPHFSPIGRWIEEDIILHCMHEHQGVVNRAAESLGIPETTLRRKVGRLKETYGNEQPSRPLDWQDLGAVFGELVEMSRERRISLLDLVSQSLFREIEGRNLARQDAARLLDVSVPTYRKLVNS